MDKMDYMYVTNILNVSSNKLEKTECEPFGSKCVKLNITQKKLFLCLGVKPQDSLRLLRLVFN